MIYKSDIMISGELNIDLSINYRNRDRYNYNEI